MGITPQRLTEILAARQREAISLLLGLSFGGIGTIAVAYYPVGRLVSPDAFALLAIMPLSIAWGIIYLWRQRGRREAMKLADMLGKPGMRTTFDRGRGRFVFELVENVDVGFGEKTEAITSRAEISLEEAQIIGISMEPQRMRSLMGPANTVPAVSAASDPLAEARSVEPARA